MELLNPLSIARANALYQRKKVKANCLSSDSVGDCVYVTGPDVSGIYQVAKAEPLDGATKMPAVALLIAKPNPTECTIQFFGEVLGLITGLTPGRVLYVDTNATLTHVPPSPTLPGEKAYIQSMGVALGTDKLFLLPDFSIKKRIT